MLTASLAFIAFLILLAIVGFIAGLRSNASKNAVDYRTIRPSPAKVRVGRYVGRR